MRLQRRLNGNYAVSFLYFHGCKFSATVHGSISIFKTEAILKPWGRHILRALGRLYSLILCEYPCFCTNFKRIDKKFQTLGIFHFDEDSGNILKILNSGHKQKWKNFTCHRI